LNTHNRPLQKWLLNTFGQNVTPGLEADDERALEEFDFAKKKGFLAHENVRWWFGSGGMIDYTNPEAVDWWQSKLKPLFESGVDFIKNDDGEDLPDDAVSFNGMDGREYHNIYGFYYGRATYQLNTTLKDLPGNSNPRQIIYSRNVWVGSQRFPALFLGDQEADFEGIKRSIRAGLNLAICGFSYWTADIFGLSGKTTAEVHMRYAQWALCSPVARYFVRPQEIDNTRFPWSHNSEVTDNFRKYTELRMRLLPYYNTLAHESYKTGMPLLRPPMFEFQDDARFLSNDDQIMLGNSLMICPVVEAGVTERKIIIPKGSWYDFWSDKTWQGPTEIIYQAPLDRLPILVRGGSIVPMGPVIQNIPAGHKFDLLEYHIWPPFSAETDFYDDDGQSTAYQQGGFTSTHINVKLSGKHLEINISPNMGYFDELQTKCQIYIIIHDQNFAESAFVNKKEIQIQFTPVTYIVKFEHQMNKDTRVEFLYRQK
ncbi:MAG: TIM-barrel domain-containing protein, partial [Chloroflexota bacterium]